MAMDETGPEEPLTPEDFAEAAEDAADTPQPLAFPCPEGETGRLDQWLAGVSGISRSRIQTLLRQGAVRTAANAVPTGRRATPGETYIIHLPPPEPVELLPENIPLDILYEDEAILVVNKPAGLVVHPAAGHPHGTLVNALLYHCPGMLSVGGEARPGIVHRLDQDTSGLLVVAKRDDALNALWLWTAMANGRTRSMPWRKISAAVHSSECGFTRGARTRFASISNRSAVRSPVTGSTAAPRKTPCSPSVPPGRCCMPASSPSRIRCAANP